MKKIVLLLPLLCFLADGMNLRAKVRDTQYTPQIASAIVSPVQTKAAPVTPANDETIEHADVKQVMEAQSPVTINTTNIEEGSVIADGSSSKENFIKTAISIVLKEPVRLIQFAIKTGRLQKEGKDIPACFKACTTVRFLGATVIDGCLVASMVNQFLEKPFLEGTNSWIWFGSLAGGMACNYAGRTIVKTMYQDTSNLYGEQTQE